MTTPAMNLEAVGTPMEEVTTARPQINLSPAAVAAIAAAVNAAPRQPFRGASPVPELVLPGAAAAMGANVEPIARSGTNTVAMYYNDGARLNTLPSVVPGINTVELYAGDRARRVVLTGDRNSVLQHYKQGSLCNQLVANSLNRIQQALMVLDDRHANIIRARLQKAGVANANASHASMREITFKKATSIALQAERWVYQAQAAAAKSMVKESKRCLHNLAGRAKRSREDKEAAYQARFGVPRGTRSDRAARKLRRRIDGLNTGQ